jgi:hypothetical protein
MQDVEFILGVSHPVSISDGICLIQQQFPHRVQQIMSGENTPILAGAIPAFEMFMTGWEKAAEDHTHLANLIQPGLDWAYLYYGRMDRTRAYIIAMCK